MALIPAGACAATIANSISTQHTLQRDRAYSNEVDTGCVAMDANVGSTGEQRAPQRPAADGRGADDGSEHRIRVSRLLGNDLQDIPMLDDPAVVIEAEDVDAGPVPVAGPLLPAVENDVVSLGNHAFEVNPLAWILARQALELLDERVLAVGDGGVC